MNRYLMVTLEAPLMAFGAETVDARGVVRDFPGASNLTGLLANALGWTRAMGPAHQRLQERLRFAIRLDRAGHTMSDFQTAKLEANDKGWTTFGVPEGRAGGADTYKSPHIRLRDYKADAKLRLAIALAEPSAEPTLDDLAAALERPARPLFFGRKPCLPARPLLGSEAAHWFIEADNPFMALVADAATPQEAQADLVGAEIAGLPQGFARFTIADERNWISGVHGGRRIFSRGSGSLFTPAPTAGAAP